MTTLLQRLHDELVRRHYATTTLESYLKILKGFQRHIGKRLDRVGPEDLRRYQAYVLEERRLAVGTVVAQLAALRFFYLRVLKRRNMKEDLPYPKRPRRLPIILSPDEVQRLIAGTQNLFHRTMLMTLDGGGLRRSELLHLKVGDIDSERRVFLIERGKGGHDREVPLSPTLLTALRAYYRWMRPQTYLFPGTQNGWRADKPLSARVIWDAVRFAARTAGIDKHVHTLGGVNCLRDMQVRRKRAQHVAVVARHLLLGDQKV